MSHALKKVKREPTKFSYVSAVKRLGDAWSIISPLLKVGLEDKTQDWRELQRMTLMERGILPRVEDSYDESYERINVGEYGFGYCATRENYDEGHPIGIGYTRYQAIADLIEAEELANG